MTKHKLCQLIDLQQVGVFQTALKNVGVSPTRPLPQGRRMDNWQYVHTCARQNRYDSPANFKTALRVAGETRNPKFARLLRIGATEEINPFFFALIRTPRVPVKGMPSNSAACRPKPSSSTTNGPLDSRASASTADSPGPRSAAKGNAGALMGSTILIHGISRTFGNSTPRSKPASNSKHTALGTVTVPANSCNRSRQPT